MGEHIIIGIISTYGYIGLFLLLTLGIVGIPVPDEVLLMFSGFMVSKGELNYLGILFGAFCGTSVGISLSFYIGHAVGMPLIHRYGSKVGITEEKIRRVEEWFHKVGKWTIFFGFFIPGFRHLTAYSAGIGNMTYKEFALYALPGGLFWSFVFITIGKSVGMHWRKVEHMIHHYALWLIPFAVVLAIASYIWFRKKKPQ
ncbi:DedA family protein [Fodinisporobacter ferrooxydans]|uniref:DedA family protein n=1 Tax=Fodinisporobacter ferrooxydans TaxID=2901836 RepID=A0ABY4CN66_9BACL|nr:DedA family protein [Alicyclobacillaceae bacterium MYW30-H2]